MNSRSLLSSSVAKHLSSAALAGVVVYLKPDRVPKRVRTALLATNAGGSATAMLVGSSSSVGASPAPLASRVGSQSDTVGDAATVVAALASSITLLTSKPALKFDRRVEKSLTRKGIRRPRLVMAGGAAGLVLVLGVVTDRLTKTVERKAEELQAKQQGQHTKPVNPMLNGNASVNGVPSANGSVVPDQKH